MIISIGQLNTTVGDMEGNVAKMLAAARQGHERGAELILFPEMAVCGYPPRDLVQVNGFAESNRRWLLEFARCLPKTITAVAGFVARSTGKSGKPFINAAAVLRGGKVVYEQAKVLLPTYDVFDEMRNFEPGQKLKPFRAAGQSIGLTICEDCWNDKYFWKRRLYDRDPVAEILRTKPRLLINISASPYASGRRAFRQEMFGAIARRYKIPIVFTNLVGGNDSLVFDGSSFVMNSSGKVVAQAKSFEEDLLVVDLAAKAAPYVAPGESETEAIFNALVLGTRDYCRKCGFERAVVGLSG